ncbi:MAG: biosynthetic-type acetolactate synthase large subunit [Lachnospirales bacterium]
MILNGSEILIECLLEQNVDTIFGYPGGAVLNIYDALYKYKDKIKHYLTSHEQHATHAADGYARVTNKVGVCLATSGPGATNTVTGIATAFMDSIPLVCITGNVGTSLLGKDSFQEVDIAGIVMPVVKHSFIVKDVKDLANTIRRAFKIANSGRRGPVLIDIPKDVSIATCEYIKEVPENCTNDTFNHFTSEELDKAIALIENSKKPFVFAGGGVIASKSYRELKEFVEKIDSPVAISLMGKGAIPSTYKNFTGLLGMHGTKASNLGVTNCDLLIVLGARFSDRVTSDVSKFAPKAKIIHIDIDPAEIDKNVTVDLSLIGDLKNILQKLNSSVAKKENNQWIDYIQSLIKDYPLQNDSENGLKPWHILEAINKVTNNDCIISTEVGQHQIFAAQYINSLYPHQFVTSGGLGTMGYGLGASIGAQVGKPDKVVFNIAGDGSFRMNNIELATAVEYNLPIIVCIFNNHVLGMVRQWQSLFYDKRYSSTDLSTKTTDFVALAKAYQCDAYNVNKIEEVEDTLKTAIANKKPCVINFELYNDDVVYPMVKLGSGIDDFIE